MRDLQGDDWLAKLSLRSTLNADEGFQTLLEGMRRDVGSAFCSSTLPHDLLNT